ncbi:SMI1/KNR4 family protein [Antrihabitans sp. YC3-6]|uniref:SMI1/KNR4 family protein n=1 Tax=Antrihabitans stalagmiti TaxID=2799499 RepID=A0A934U334_9NOCA|nr:SMI1/KNR4 family protein [Antrihabitans stalagmiti]MBJ8338598.1 SMI1/KNR4 family protein [Antrihabitans stalagmiti]
MAESRSGFDRLASFAERWGGFAAPVGADRFVEFEASFGFTFPEDLAWLYGLGDGGPMAGDVWLRLDDVFVIKAKWDRDLASVGDPCVLDYGIVSVDGRVQASFWRRGWIPFVSSNGMLAGLAVDCDPGPGGRVGQVITFGDQDDTKYVVAESVPTLIDAVAGLVDKYGDAAVDPHDGYPLVVDGDSVPLRSALRRYG